VPYGSVLLILDGRSRYKRLDRALRATPWGGAKGVPTERRAKSDVKLEEGRRRMCLGGEVLVGLYVLLWSRRATLAAAPPSLQSSAVGQRHEASRVAA